MMAYRRFFPLDGVERRDHTGRATWFRLGGAVVAISVAIGPVAGCLLGGSSRDTESGELGAGAFTYRCAGVSDPYCTDGEASEFPRALAVGAAFRLDYETSDGIPAIVEGGSDALVTTDDHFSLGRAGYVAVIARDGAQRVVDLMHLRGRDVASIELAVDEGGEDGDVRLAAGERTTIHATPTDADSAVLGGSLEYAWTVDDPTIAAWMATDRGNAIEVVAVAAGLTSVTVTAGERTEVVTIRVEDGSTGASGSEGTTADGTEDSGSSQGVGSSSGETGQVGSTT
jgi:hypothetical protein